ncbi:MAG: SGNH/GDSL hydrolase family protein [Polyangiales bacterium]
MSRCLPGLLVVAALGCSGSANKEPSILRDVECVREAEAIPPEVWEGEIEEYEAEDAARRPDPGALVFVGSSSIRFWETLSEDMAPMRALNRGFGGSVIAHSTHYADRIIVPYEPSVIVMYAGDNDLAFGGVSPECALRDFEAFVEKVWKAVPGTAIYFISIKPSPARWEIWDDIKRANALIEARTKTRALLEFIDISEAMLGENGEPDASLYVADGLHLSDRGYEFWTSIVRPRLLNGFGN